MYPYLANLQVAKVAHREKHKKFSTELTVKVLCNSTNSTGDVLLFRFPPHIEGNGRNHVQAEYKMAYQV